MLQPRISGEGDMQRSPQDHASTSKRPTGRGTASPQAESPAYCPKSGSRRKVQGGFKTQEAQSQSLAQEPGEKILRASSHHSSSSLAMSGLSLHQGSSNIAKPHQASCINNDAQGPPTPSPAAAKNFQPSPAELTPEPSGPQSQDLQPPTGSSKGSLQPSCHFTKMLGLRQTGQQYLCSMSWTLHIASLCQAASP